MLPVAPLILMEVEPSREQQPVDMGDGSPPLTAVPFTVRATINTLLVTVGVTNLPLASLTAGTIIID